MRTEPLLICPHWIKQKMETKTSIRAQIRNQKRLLTENFQREAEKQCLDKLCRTREWQQADTILTYVSYNREMGTHLLIEKAFECGKKVAAPRVEGHEMRFYYFSSFAELVKSEKNILEPGTDRPYEYRNKDLLIMPGVAFDRNRNRIGYGGGFYDKYLERHPEHFVIALAYDFQVYEEISAEIHDWKPNLIITEKRTID